MAHTVGSPLRHAFGFPPSRQLTGLDWSNQRPEFIGIASHVSIDPASRDYASYAEPR
jgi:hypothetical protein